MTNLINDFLSQPLWLTVPLVMVYLALLAYFLYILWHYRRKNTLALVLTIAALATGQKAAGLPSIVAMRAIVLLMTRMPVPIPLRLATT